MIWSDTVWFSDQIIWSDLTQELVPDQIIGEIFRSDQDQITWSGKSPDQIKIRSYDLIWSKNEFQIRSPGIFFRSDQIRSFWLDLIYKVTDHSRSDYDLTLKFRSHQVMIWPAFQIRSYWSYDLICFSDQIILIIWSDLKVRSDHT